MIISYLHISRLKPLEPGRHRIRPIEPLEAHQRPAVGGHPQCKAPSDAAARSNVNLMRGDIKELSEYRNALSRVAF